MPLADGSSQLFSVLLLWMSEALPLAAMISQHGVEPPLLQLATSTRTAARKLFVLCLRRLPALLQLSAANQHAPSP